MGCLKGKQQFPSVEYLFECVHKASSKFKQGKKNLLQLFDCQYPLSSTEP